MSADGEFIKGSMEKIKHIFLTETNFFNLGAQNRMILN
jgi:hypothetical protein